MDVIITTYVVQDRELMATRGESENRGYVCRERRKECTQCKQYMVWHYGGGVALWGRGGTYVGWTSSLQHTVWLEILAGNLFWRIGGFESNPPNFLQYAVHT